MPEPMSDEVRAMQERERAKWLSVAEGQRIREEWSRVRKSIDDLAEKFDEAPEDETQVVIFPLMSVLVLDTFMRQAHDAAKKITALQAENGRSGSITDNGGAA